MPKLHQSCPKFVYTMPSRRLIVFRPLCIRKLVGEFVLSLGQAFFMLHCSTVFSENADNTPVFCSPSSVPELLEFRGVLISSGICLWPYIIQKRDVILTLNPHKCTYYQSSLYYRKKRKRTRIRQYYSMQRMECTQKVYQRFFVQYCVDSFVMTKEYTCPLCGHVCSTQYTSSSKEG